MLNTFLPGEDSLFTLLLKALCVLLHAGEKEHLSPFPRLVKQGSRQFRGLQLGIENFLVLSKVPLPFNL